MPKRIWIWYLLAAVFWLGALLIVPFFDKPPEPISGTSEFVGKAVLVSDPRSLGSGISFRAKLTPVSNSSSSLNNSNINSPNLPSSLTAEVSAYGQNRFQLSGRLTGEWVYLRGKLKEPNPDSYFPVQAKLQVSQVGSSGGGRIHSQIANQIRRTLEKGAASLDPDQKALFTGIIYGDDRNQSLAQKDLFRSTGLTHILAVSGQNVAFLLAILYPLIGRLSNIWKLTIMALALLIFLTMTRFEPSVMRAVVMAVTAFFSSNFIQRRQDKRDEHQIPITASSITASQEKRKFRRVIYDSIQPKSTLGIAVCILILISPSIVTRLAFQLSVLASAGIIFLSLPLAQKLFGPKWLRMSLGITIAAQLAVAPLIVTNFGAIALSTLPANILALPAVGFATIWGMTAGIFAGFLGGTAAQIIHIPTKLLLGWVELVAKFSDGLNLGWLSGWHIAILFAGIFLATAIFILKRYFKLQIYLRLEKALKLAVILLVSFTLLSPTIAQAIAKKTDPQYVSPEIFRWNAHGLVVIKSHISSTRFLSTLSQSQLTDIDLLIFLYTPSEVLLEALHQRYKIKSVWVPQGKYIAQTSTLKKNESHFSGRLIFELTETFRLCERPKNSQEIQTQQLSCYTLKV